MSKFNWKPWIIFVGTAVILGVIAYATQVGF